MTFKYDVILLAYNEIETIREDIGTWEILARDHEIRIIVCEENSTDGTSQYLQELHKLGKILHCTSDRRRGYKQALLDGLRITTAEIVILSESGSKFLIEDINKILNFSPEYDVLIGRRANRDDSPIRQFLTTTYNFLARIIFGLAPGQDLDSGLRSYSRRAVDEILSIQLTFPELVSSEITLRLINKGYVHGYENVNYLSRAGASRSFTFSKLTRTASSSFARLVKLKLAIGSQRQLPKLP